MGARIEGPLADALREGRERHNARFAATKRARPALEGERFAALLASVGDPIVRAVHAHDRARTKAAADAVHDALLEIAARELDRSCPAAIEVLAASGAAMAPLVASAPRRAIATLVNATFRVASMRRDALPAWRASVARIAPACGEHVEVWRDALAIAAWQAGIPMLRGAALDGLLRAPEPVARAALAITESVAPMTEIVEGLRADAWSSPWRLARRAAPEPVFLRTPGIGGFRGLGGPFTTPPRVEASGGRLFAFAGEERFAVWADRFGAWLEPSAPAAAGVARGEALTLRHDGRVTGFGAGSPGALVEGPVASWASIGRTLVAVPDRSHRIIVIGLAEST